MKPYFITAKALMNDPVSMMQKKRERNMAQHTLANLQHKKS